MSLEPKRVYWRVPTSALVQFYSLKLARKALDSYDKKTKICRVSVYDAKARREDIARQIAEAVAEARRDERAKCVAEIVSSLEGDAARAKMVDIISKRIADLERLASELLDALPRCINAECNRRATRGLRCEEHAPAIWKMEKAIWADPASALREAIGGKK